MNGAAFETGLIHNDVLPTTRHVSEERKLFDVGEIEEIKP